MENTQGCTLHMYLVQIPRYAAEQGRLTAVMSFVKLETLPFIYNF